jgi:hypothetical protein
MFTINNTKQKKEFWDIDETDTFVKVHSYNVLKKHNPEKRIFYSLLLEFFDTTTKKIQSFYRDKIRQYIKTNCKDNNTIIKNTVLPSQILFLIPNLILFVNTPHRFSEISDNPYFSGINKPKNIYESTSENDIFINVHDKLLRATWRLVMLKLSLPPKKLYELYVHEIAHTFANHVQYRHDDHKEDYIRCYNLFLKMTIQHNVYNQLVLLYENNNK